MVVTGGSDDTIISVDMLPGKVVVTVVPCSTRVVVIGGREDVTTSIDVVPGKVTVWAG